MLYSLFINAATSLLIGLTLLWLWRQHGALVFARDLGLAFMVQTVIPVGFLLADHPGSPARAVGLPLTYIGALVYQVLVLAGCLRLAGYAPRTGWLLVFGVAVVAINAPAYGSNDWRAVQVVNAITGTVLGSVFLALLWRRGRAERVAGLALFVMGLNVWTMLWAGPDGKPLQAAVAAVMRIGLGLAVMVVALERAAADTARSRAHFEGLVSRSPQGIMVHDGKQVLYTNPALLAIYGFRKPADVTAQSLNAAVPPEDLQRVHERYQRLRAGEIGEASWEGPRRRADGSPLFLRFLAWRTEWDGRPAVQVMVNDQTAQRDATQALLHQATHDRLTGLPNRAALQQRLARCSDGSCPPFALLLLDIDRFQLFNEAHGLSLGDEVLRTLARSLQQVLDGSAELMHLGEDEFAIQATGIADEAAARAVAGQVQQLLTRPLALSRHEFFIDVSMGLALYPATSIDGETLLRAANAAMHVAKRTPGTSLAVADTRFERGSVELLGQEQALRAGLQNREFQLCYQPKVDARSGRLVGFEALARWHRPGAQQAVSPVEFIAAAERTGLIGDLGALLLDQACAQIARWRQQHGGCPPVAVNVSPLQMLDAGFVGLVERTLALHTLPPEALAIEITESAAMVNQEQAREQIAQLRGLGVEVALDDFGTGFSSLNMLRSLPLRAVKIDRGLIDPLPARAAAAVVQAVCQLASVLGMQVVAEGVETDAQAAAAAAAGCHELQGYRFSRPLYPADVEGWLTALHLTATSTDGPPPATARSGYGTLPEPMA